MIPAIATFGFRNFFRLTFEIGASQIVKQNVKMCGKQILPALSQMLEQLLLMLQQAVQAAIQPVLFRHREIGTQQIGHSGLIEPLAVHLELAARSQ